MKIMIYSFNYLLLGACLGFIFWEFVVRFIRWRMCQGYAPGSQEDPVTSFMRRSFYVAVAFAASKLLLYLLSHCRVN